eukprot:COSAG03_NODE_4527_length_1521_cov_3.092124_2_plen_179_part_00
MKNAVPFRRKNISAFGPFGKDTQFSQPRGLHRQPSSPPGQRSGAACQGPCGVGLSSGAGVSSTPSDAQGTQRRSDGRVQSPSCVDSGVALVPLAQRTHPTVSSSRPETLPMCPQMYVPLMGSLASEGPCSRSRHHMSDRHRESTFARRRTQACDRRRSTILQWQQAHEHWRRTATSTP